MGFGAVLGPAVLPVIVGDGVELAARGCDGVTGRSGSAFDASCSAVERVVAAEAPASSTEAAGSGSMAGLPVLP
ncbi:MAG: hypothetical protein M3O50_15790, partial [Myxococcota bacterium]|nr:hypothetical protein [Myxococcota bacterium]